MTNTVNQIDIILLVIYVQCSSQSSSKSKCLHNPKYLFNTGMRSLKTHTRNFKKYFNTLINMSEFNSLQDTFSHTIVNMYVLQTVMLLVP